MRKTMLQVEKRQTESVDSLDCQILNLMQKDCHLSFNKITDKSGASVGTAYNPIKRLEAKKIIKDYTTRCDSTKMGYGLTAFILVQTENVHLIDVKTFFAKTPNVTSVYEITGDYDMCIIAKFNDRNKLNMFLKQSSTSPYVKRTLTNVALTTV